MTGFKTLLWNGLLVIVGAILPWLAGIDWTQFVSPQIAVIIVAVINIVLRIFTETPIFKRTA